MRPRVSAILGVGLVLGAAALAANVVANERRRLGGPASDGDLVVAKVGPRAISVGALEGRMRTLPDFQLATFGANPAEISRHFLERVVIRDELLAAGAEAKKLDQEIGVRERVQQALRTARIADLRGSLAISDEEIAAYFAANRERFESPERIAVTRILCATRDEAVRILSEVASSGGPQRWNDLAREHSLDKATSLRGGALGFLAPDGSSSEPSVRVDPAIFTAASGVKDGQFVREPVEEGKAFAVIWRRGSTPAVHRTLEQETGAIRQVLVRRKLGDGVKALVDELRQGIKIETHPDLVDLIEVSPDGDVSPRKRPGVAKRSPASGPAPSMTPSGLR